MDEEPIDWQAYEVLGARTVRIHFEHLSPIRTLRRVVVEEQPELVRIQLWLPRTAGKMSAVRACIDVELQAPVGERELFDAYTGRRAALTSGPTPGQGVAGCQRVAPQYI